MYLLLWPPTLAAAAGAVADCFSELSNFNAILERYVKAVNVSYIKNNEHLCIKECSLNYTEKTLLKFSTYIVRIFNKKYTFMFESVSIYVVIYSTNDI